MEFNDVRLQYDALKEEIDAAVARTLSGGRYILGPALMAFEDEFARYCNTANGVGVNSGTDALAIGLRALGVESGDEVLVPAASATATAMAVTLIGAMPVFVDVSPDNYTMDPERAEECRTSRTKAMAPVHLYGMPARLKDLARLGLPILEDAAQAHGSEAKWGRCGSFGEAAAFSFYPTKNLGTYGDAGMLVTSDTALAERARLLRNYGERGKYASDTLGQNSRLDEIHAAILRIKLRELDQWNRRRRQIASAYRQAFENVPVQLQAETGTSNYHLFVIATERRDKLRAHLSALDIPALVHYPVPLHRQKAFADARPSRCPNAELLCARVLSLPIHAFMSDGEVERVIDGVKSFFRRKRDL